MTAFYGRVQTYVNRNGKEHREDREFRDPRDFDRFLSTRQDVLPTFGLLGDLGDAFGLTDRPLGWDVWFPAMRCGAALPDAKLLPDGVKLDEYEKAREKIEKEAAERAEKAAREAEARRERIWALRDARERLSEHAEAFRAAGRDDLADRAMKDLAKVEAERAELEN